MSKEETAIDGAGPLQTYFSALAAVRHMHEFGTSPEQQLVEVTVSARAGIQLNPAV